MHIRTAQPHDDATLLEIDRLTWTTLVSPAPPPDRPTTFFTDRVEPADVLVATDGSEPIGYTQLRSGYPFPAHAHVHTLAGLAVHPSHTRQGTGRALVEAAIDLARHRHARKLTLRVLSTNTPALRLYYSTGFTREGVLEAEFLLAGQWIDDVLLAHHIQPRGHDSTS